MNNPVNVEPKVARWRAVRIFGWLPSVVLERLVRRLFPDVCQTRPETIRAMRELGRKLADSEASVSRWRDRALSAERAAGYELKQAVNSAFERHDREHGTGLRWGI